MDPDEVEAAKILLRKDAIASRYAAIVAWWQATTGAGMGASVLAVAGRLGGQLDSAATIGLTFLGGLLVVAGVWGWFAQEGRFERAIGGLVGGLERLKKEPHP